MKKLVGAIFAILLLPVYVYAYDFYDDGWITDGNVFDTVNIYNDANITMTGGEVGTLDSYNYSHLGLTNGFISVWLDGHNSSIIEMSGGYVGHVALMDSSIMHWSGGNIDGYISIRDDAILHVYGKDFLYVAGGGYGFGWLSGHWANGSDFTILFRHLPEPFPPESSVILHIIPEPCTFGLIGFGFFILRRKVKNLH
jgi:hypothetical protein